jgi:hypothetical protein
MNDLIASQIRTWVPVAVGALASWLETRGLHIDADALAGLIAFLTALSTAVYYLVARLLEKYVSPKFGWLLGWAKAPNYAPAAKLPSDI